MSFDIFLRRFVGGEPAEAHRDQVRAVLQANHHSGPDRYGFYVVNFPDGVDVELSAKGLDGSESFKGCAFHVRGMSSHLAEFILKVAKAGDMILLPAMEDAIPILSSPHQLSQLPPDLVQGGRRPILCDLPKALERILAGGYAAWERHRNQTSQ